MFKRLKSKAAEAYLFSFLLGLSAPTIVILGTAAAAITISQLSVSKDMHRFNKAVDVCVGETIGITEIKDQNGKVVSSLVDEVNNRIDEVRAADPGIRDACIVEVQDMSESERLEYIKDI